jgi:hypothetical protein|nr:MAG TPA: hypothetical protein [Caudoviricetes sp.]
MNKETAENLFAELKDFIINNSETDGETAIALLRKLNSFLYYMNLELF